MISDYLKNWELWPFKYGFRFLMAKPGDAGDAILGAAMSLQGDADFVYRALSIDLQVGGVSVNDFSGAAPQNDYLVATSSYARYTRKMYLPDSRAIQTLHQYSMEQGFFLNSNAPMPGMMAGASFISGAPGLNYANDGDALRPLPIIPEVLLGKSSALTVDLQNYTAANEFLAGQPLAIEICFHGWKLFRKGTHYSIDRTKRYLALPFSYYSPIPVVAPSGDGQLIPANVQNLDSGSAFLLMAVQTQGWNSGFQFQYYGPETEQTSFSNSSARHGLLSRGNSLGSGRFPGVITPPLQYPAAGRILWDYYLPGGVSQALGSNGQPGLIEFQGVKLYAL